MRVFINRNRVKGGLLCGLTGVTSMRCLRAVVLLGALSQALAHVPAHHWPACGPGEFNRNGCECEVCPSGKYKPTTSRRGCTNCRAGKASPTPAAVAYSSCASCRKGEWAAGAAATCTKCVAGTFSKYTRSRRASQCLTCFPGRYRCETEPTLSRTFCGGCCPPSSSLTRFLLCVCVALQ